MSFLQTMSISRESMMNNQFALTVVSNNISNMNTSGYSKQRANFVSNNGMNPANNIAGIVYSMSGAKIGDIISYANSTINTSVRNDNSKAQYFGQLNNMLSNMNQITNDLGDEGLQKVMGEFFTAAQNLSKTPGDKSARLAYVQASKNVASRFNSVYTSLETQKSDIAGNGLVAAGSKIDTALQEVNMNLKKVADLNAQILKTGTEGGASNELIDERNRVLDEISSTIPITVSDRPGGTVSVMLDNIRLVNGAVQEQELTCSAVNNFDSPIKVQVKNIASGKISVDNLNDVLGERGGIGAMLTMVTSKPGFVSLNYLMGQMDVLANDFADAVNDIQQFVSADGNTRACYLVKNDVTGETTLAHTPPPPPMFVGTGAKGIRVSDEINANNQLVTTARVNVDPVTNPDWAKSVGDGSNMLLMAELRDKSVVDSSGLGILADSKIEAFLSSLTLKVGVQGKDIQTKAETTASVVRTTLNERNSIVGVNMDEELADMIKFQRSYEASARLFTVANEALQTLINLGR